MNMSATVTESTSLPQREAQHHAVTFTGNGREYFGIWIVNVLLSIVTLVERRAIIERPFV